MMSVEDKINMAKRIAADAMELAEYLGKNKQSSAYSYRLTKLIKDNAEILEKSS